jgi:hypothetical protein
MELAAQESSTAVPKVAGAQVLAGGLIGAEGPIITEVVVASPETNVVAAMIPARVFVDL